MTYENLMRLQDAAQLIFGICILGGFIFFLIGLIRPTWVVLSTIGAWLFGSIVYGGTIAYTHSQPNDPHAFQSYMDGMIAKICIQNPVHHSCPELRGKCASGDATHPSCRVLAGEDPRQFYRSN